MIVRGIVLFFAGMTASVALRAQPHLQQGLIYGRVETVEDQILEGVLRWGNEEAFWDDLFIAHKSLNKTYFEYLSGDEIRVLTSRSPEESLDWSFWGLWRPRYPTNDQQFRCQFGDIASIEVTGPTTALLYFKDGDIQPVQNGPGPGKELHLFDRDDVETRISWGRIRRIEFLPTPPGARKEEVKPLFGVVFTPQGAFEGFIQWDAQERLTTDLLDGKNSSGKVSLPFEDIEEIRSMGDSSTVRTFSGRIYTIGGGDDVGPENHGIIVKNINLGHVRIPWNQFSFVRFEKSPRMFSPGYEEFGLPQQLCASLTTSSGRLWSGRCVFDLDEHLSLETIEGEKDGIIYHIPIRNIDRLERKNYNVCGMTLRNGDQLFLGDQHDLTDANWGILIWVSEEQVRYIPWNEVSTIRF